jgi:hypothetical protein
MRTLPTDAEVDASYWALWAERDQVTAQVGIIWRLCAICGHEEMRVSEASADEAIAAHVNESHKEAV